MKKIMMGLLLVVSVNFVSAKKVILQEGTIINIKLIETLDSRLANVGDLVHFEVTDDIIIKKRVAIKKGARVVGRIEEVQSNRLFGKKGTLSLTIDYVEATDGKNVNVNYQHQENSNQKGGILKKLTFKNVTMPKGKEFDIFVSRDYKIKV